MTDATVYLAVAGLAATGILATAGVIRTRAAWVPILFLIMTALAAGLGASTMPGQPKSATTELARPREAEVLWNAASKKEGRIYLLLSWEGRAEPGYYWLPWDAKLEKAMSKARHEAMARGRSMMVRDPFGHGMQPGEPGEDGDGPPGSGKAGHGKGRGRGAVTGDNAQADEAFYVSPPAPLPEKDQPAAVEESTEQL